MVSPLNRQDYYPGDAITLKTWWRTLQPPPLDYSVGVYLRPINGASIVAASNAGLTLKDSPTSQWIPSDDYKFDPLKLNLLSNLLPRDHHGNLENILVRYSRNFSA